MPRTTTGATSGSSTERARPVIVELIRSLYRYNDWANGRILDASARLTCEQLLEGGGASFDSARDTLVHTMGAEWQMIHQVNHAIQHRSEAAVMLTKLGHSPGWLDLLYFVDLVGGPDMAPPPPPPPPPPRETRGP